MAEGSGLYKVTSRPIFYRWWFWLALVVAFAVVWYLQGYIGWFGDQAKYRLQNSVVNNYIAGQEVQQKQLENAYKNDPYGGTTPEETLKLFIEALEKKDYVLASNYFIPESKDGFTNKVDESIRSGGMRAFVSSYRAGNVRSVPYANSDKFEIDVYENKGSAPFRVNFSINPFTKKWLISEL